MHLLTEILLYLSELINVHNLHYTSCLQVKLNNLVFTRVKFAAARAAYWVCCSHLLVCLTSH